MSLSKVRRRDPSDSEDQEFLKIKFQRDMYKKLLENIFAKCDSNVTIRPSEINKHRNVMEFYEKSTDLEEITPENSIKENNIDTTIEAEIRARWKDKSITNKCPACAKTFKAPSNVIQHYQACHGTKRWLCKICNKGFRDEKSAKDHVQSDHLFDKPYKCDICDMHFTIPWNRDRHQNADHIFLTSGDDIYVRQAGMKKITIRKWSPSDKLGVLTQLYLIIWTKEGKIKSISIDYTSSGDVTVAADVLRSMNLNNINSETTLGCSYTELLRSEEDGGKGWDFDPKKAIPLEIYGYDDSVGHDLKYAMRRWTEAECVFKGQKSELRLINCEDGLRAKFEMSFSKMTTATVNFLNELGWLSEPGKRKGEEDPQPTKKSKTERVED